MGAMPLKHSANAVISPHPAAEVDLTTADAPIDQVEPPTPRGPVVEVTNIADLLKAEPGANSEIKRELPPCFPGWCQPDTTASTPLTLPIPQEPVVPVAELAVSLGSALVIGIAMGATVAYLLSKRTLDE